MNCHTCKRNTTNALYSNVRHPRFGWVITPVPYCNKSTCQDAAKVRVSAIGHPVPSPNGSRRPGRMTPL